MTLHSTLGGYYKGSIACSLPLALVDQKFWIKNSKRHIAWLLGRYNSVLRHSVHAAWKETYEASKVWDVYFSIIFIGIFSRRQTGTVNRQIIEGDAICPILWAQTPLVRNSRKWHVVPNALFLQEREEKIVRKVLHCCLHLIQCTCLQRCNGESKKGGNAACDLDYFF